MVRLLFNKVKNYFEEHPFIFHLVAYIVIVMALTVNVQYYVNLAEENEQFSVDLHDGLVKSCEENTNPLREAVTARFEQENAQSKIFLETGEYAKYFPNVPQEELDAVIGKQIRQNEKYIKTIKPVNCEALYPAPPGK